MPIQHSISRVSDQPQPLQDKQITTEALREKMIVAAPQMLLPKWMIIDPQEGTGHGGRINLPALAPDGMGNAE